MMTTIRRGLMGAVAATVLLAPAAAQAQIMRVSGADTKQSVTFHLGAFFPKGEDSRDDDDVLRTNLESLLFDIKDFRGFSGGAEWAFALTEFIELGADVSYDSKSVPSIYADVVHNDGREIDGNHRGGVSLVIEAVLQAPSFVYQHELGQRESDGTFRLTPHELATKLALYLTDTLPDGLSFASATGDGWACEHAAGTVTCEHGGPIPGGAGRYP